MNRAASCFFLCGVLAAAACRPDHWLGLKASELTRTQAAAYGEIRSAARDLRGEIVRGGTEAGDRDRFVRLAGAVKRFCAEGCGAREEAFLADYFSRQISDAGLKLDARRKAEASARALRGYRDWVLPELPEAARHLH